MPELSPSQVDLYLRCQRQWAARYLHRFPRGDQGEAAALGQAVHETLAKWLKHGVWPDAKTLPGAIAHRAIPLLPEPSKEHVVEERFHFVYDDVLWQGNIDLLWEDGHPLVVHDHKTTGKIEYAKEPEQLEHDPAAIIYNAYVKDMLRRVGEANRPTREDWLYLQKDNKRRPRLVTTATVDGMAAITVVGKRILKLYEERPDMNSLPKSLDACEAFGGCPYKEQCSRTAEDRWVATRIQQERRASKMGFFSDKLKAQAGAPAAAAPQTSTQVISDGIAARATLADKVAAAAAQGNDVAVNPPAFVPPEAAAAGIGRDVSAMPTAASIPSSEPVPGGLEEAITNARAETPKRRGRPAGSTNKPKVAPETFASDEEGGKAVVTEAGVKLEVVRDGVASENLTANDLVAMLRAMANLIERHG